MPHTASLALGQPWLHITDSVSNRDPLLSDNPYRGPLDIARPGFDWDAWARAGHMPVRGLVISVDNPTSCAGAAPAMGKHRPGRLKSG